ncbi:hypothetical protein [Coleofasciculus sp.]|uniref:hypothetical protein n=1 Tax=Coleofasciculus sp. TaxID=3100458 RepID=UPI003A4435CB
MSFVTRLLCSCAMFLYLNGFVRFPRHILGKAGQATGEGHKATGLSCDKKAEGCKVLAALSCTVNG